MKIESLVKRTLEDGTPGMLLKNFMGSGTDYLFAPETEDGPHVCEVKTKEHYKRFLSITEGFEFYDPDDEGNEELRHVQSEIQQEEEEEVERLEQEEAEKRDRWPDIMDIAVQDGKEWPVKRLNQYAIDKFGINPKSKKEIREYADEMYGIILPAALRSPGPMLKALIEGIQASKEN